MKKDNTLLILFSDNDFIHEYRYLGDILKNTLDSRDTIDTEELRTRIPHTLYGIYCMCSRYPLEKILNGTMLDYFKKITLSVYTGKKADIMKSKIDNALLDINYLHINISTGEIIVDGGG